MSAYNLLSKIIKLILQNQSSKKILLIISFLISHFNFISDSFELIQPIPHKAKSPEKQIKKGEGPKSKTKSIFINFEKEEEEEDRELLDLLVEKRKYKK